MNNSLVTITHVRFYNNESNCKLLYGRWLCQSIDFGTSEKTVVTHQKLFLVFPVHFIILYALLEEPVIMNIFAVCLIQVFSYFFVLFLSHGIFFLQFQKKTNKKKNNFRNFICKSKWNFSSWRQFHHQTLQLANVFLKCCTL